MKWAKADLVVRLCRALDVAKRALELFAVEGYADAESPQNSFRPEKTIAETAMLLYAAFGVTGIPDVATRVEELALLVLPHARSQRTLLNIALHPAIGLDFAVPHVLLTKLGYVDASFDEVLRSCVNSQVRQGHERPPFASVEQRWIVSLFTDSGPGRDWRPDLKNSVLNHPMDILGGDRADAYAFTHLMMYCTDFGFRPSVLPRSRSVILVEARSLLAKCLDDEDYDLGAEVLMAWPLSGARWCAASDFVFRVLASVEDQVGVLPAGTTKTDRLSKLEGNERTQYVFGTAYHTAYVMGMLCAASLRPGRAPSVRISGPGVEKTVVDDLLLFLDTDQGHWQPEFGKLTEAEQRALAPLLLDLAIVQKCRKHDYQAVAELLVAGNEYGLTASPLCGQAAELLERLALCSHIITAAAASPTQS